MLRTALVAALAACAGAFQARPVVLRRSAARRAGAPLLDAAADDAARGVSPPLPEELGPYLTIKGKSVNPFGALYGVQSVLFLGSLWWLALSLTETVCEATGWDEDREFHDWVGKTWSKVNMAVGGCAPSVVSGQENVPPKGQAALFVSNHASWFDIPLVAQCIPNHFKFMAAEELRNLPLVGQQLRDGKHILIDRTSRRDQLKAFKGSVRAPPKLRPRSSPPTTCALTSHTRGCDCAGGVPQAWHLRLCVPRGHPLTRWPAHALQGRSVCVSCLDAQTHADLHEPQAPHAHAAHARPENARAHGTSQDGDEGGCPHRAHHHHRCLRDLPVLRDPAAPSQRR
tara:strand:- start:1642 stop:2667 length:1026 start_codon:yes stop_codon:yes gene_type:complete